MKELRGSTGDGEITQRLLAAGRHYPPSAKGEVQFSEPRAWSHPEEAGTRVGLFRESWSYRDTEWGGEVAGGIPLERYLLSLVLWSLISFQWLISWPQGVQETACSGQIHCYREHRAKGQGLDLWENRARTCTSAHIYTVLLFHTTLLLSSLYYVDQIFFRDGMILTLLRDTVLGSKLKKVENHKQKKSLAYPKNTGKHSLQYS